MNQYKLMHSTILGEDFVYPGHPLAIGIVIMTIFESYKDANETTADGNSRAISDPQVPGNSDCVDGTMKMLALGAAGNEIDQMISYAENFWKSSQENSNERAFIQGVLQARKLENLFRKKATAWFK